MDPTAALIPRVYRLLAIAVEDGVGRGWERAHKHPDNPTPEAVKQEIEGAVMLNICEAFHIIEPKEETP